MTRTVVHFIDTTEFGGAERALLNLVAHHDRGHWRPVLVHPPAPRLAPLLEGAAAAGVELRAVAEMKRLRGAAHLPAFLRVLARVRPDVFHAHLNWPLACSAALLGAAALGVRARLATVQLYGPLPRALTLDLQRALVVRSVGRYLAVSEGVAALLRDELGVPAARIRVVPNAVVPNAVAPDDASTDLDGARAAVRAALGVPPDRPFVLTLARLTAQKGLACLVEAAARVPGAVFAVAGEGPEHEALEAQIGRLAFGDRVRLLGFRRDTSALLAACDLFVLPSLYEGLPLSVLEAMAAGKAVVATAIPGNNEAVVHGETGLLVPPDDPAALACAIGALLDDAPRARRMGARGARRIAERFSARAMARAAEGVYDELLAARARPGGGA